MRTMMAALSARSRLSPHAHTAVTQCRTNIGAARADQAGLEVRHAHSASHTAHPACSRDPQIRTLSLLQLRGQRLEPQQLGDSGLDGVVAVGQAAGWEEPVQSAEL